MEVIIFFSFKNFCCLNNLQPYSVVAKYVLLTHQLGPYFLKILVAN